MNICHAERIAGSKDFLPFSCPYCQGIFWQVLCSFKKERVHNWHVESTVADCTDFLKNMTVQSWKVQTEKLPSVKSATIWSWSLTLKIGRLKRQYVSRYIALTPMQALIRIWYMKLERHLESGCNKYVFASTSIVNKQDRICAVEKCRIMQEQKTVSPIRCAGCQKSYCLK